MQSEKQSNLEFSERTDALAQTLGLSLRDLAAYVGISQAMLFAYRTGKNPITEKAWQKIRAAEAKSSAAVSEHYFVTETENAQRLPEWWNTIPPPSECLKLRETHPFLFERLKIAAERTFMGDFVATHGKKRKKEQEYAFSDAISDLGLPGTGAAMTPQFETLMKAYSDELYRLRSEPIEEKIAEQMRAATRSTIAEIVEAIMRRMTGHGEVSAAVAEKLAQSDQSLRGSEVSGRNTASTSHRAAGD